MKNNNGVTMLSLVVTIIILIIFAGVSLKISIGDNGLIDKTASFVDKANADEVKKNVEILLRKMCEKYYDEKYKNEDFEFENEGQYIVNNINYNDLEDYTIKFDQNNSKKILIYSEEEQDLLITSGEVQDDGKIIWE